MSTISACAAFVSDNPTADAAVTTNMPLRALVTALDMIAL